MDNIIDCRLDSTCKEIYTGIWQHDYGQILRITGVDLPKAVEVQFSLRDKGGDTLTRIGTTVDGVTEVKVPDSFLKNENCTQNYLIYAWIYVTDDASGNTEYQIILHVKSRPKPEEPSEEPLPEPNIFHETVEAVNASADRAEMAEQSAKGSAEKAETTLAEIKRVTDGISEDIENANTAKSELSGMIDSAEEKKKELVASTEEAGETKMELDSSINSAEEKKLALDATVEQANAVDASLKEQIGSAEQIQANVEQIGKNTQAISSLNEDLEEVKDKKITKFYASNQGETHLEDSDNGKIQDMIIYGRSSQFTTTGKNLFKYPYVSANDRSNGIIFTDNKDGSISVSGTATGKAYYNFYMNIDGKRLTLESGTYKLVVKGRSKCNVVVSGAGKSIENKGTFTIKDEHNGIYCYIVVHEGVTVDETIYPMIQLASSTDESYEPYTGGKPSPNPDYPQEIKSVGDSGSVAVKVTGKNILDMRKSRESITNSGVTYARNADYSFTRTGTATDSIGNVWMAGGYMVKPNADLSNVFCVLLKGVTYSIKDCVLIACSPDGKALVARNENFVPTQDMYITGVRNENFIINKTYNDIVYPAVYVGAKALQYEPYREQLLTLPYTLNAIPVSRDGNVTIDGQQYIADRVVEKDGVFGIERNIREIHTNTKTMNNSEEYPGWNKVEGVSDATYYNEQPVGTARVLTYISNFTQTDLCQNNINSNNIVFFRLGFIGYSQSELIAKAIDVHMYIRLQDAIFEPLPGDIQAKLRTLVTNYPVTNISVTSDQLDGYTVFNYPISMANGWNYVKQQLNDNRDYIYDMDIQSAEAYVNSEYAVALTELEV